MATDIPVESFLLWRSIWTVPRYGPISHLGGFELRYFEARYCKRVVHTSPGSQYLVCRGLIFVPPDIVVSIMADLSINMPRYIKTLFLVLDGRTPAFKESLDWMQFTFMGERRRHYIVTAANSLICPKIT